MKNFIFAILSVFVLIISSCTNGTNVINPNTPIMYDSLLYSKFTIVNLNTEDTLYNNVTVENGNPLNRYRIGKDRLTTGVDYLVSNEVDLANVNILIKWAWGVTNSQVPTIANYRSAENNWGQIRYANQMFITFYDEDIDKYWASRISMNQNVVTNVTLEGSYNFNVVYDSTFSGTNEHFTNYTDKTLNLYRVSGSMQMNFTNGNSEQNTMFLVTYEVPILQGFTK